jgi:hypothetical protein
VSKGYGIMYVDTKALIEALQAGHDYAAANEHRADYWTAMAAYLQSTGLSWRYTPPRTPIDWQALGLEAPAQAARCSVCGGDHPTNDHMPTVKPLDPLVSLLHEAHIGCHPTAERGDFRHHEAAAYRLRAAGVQIGLRLEADE